MDAKRLEELVEWATTNARWCHLFATDQDKQYFADLARCAAAWARVEREAQPREVWKWVYEVGFGVTKSYTSGHSTPIEAVEAAEVGQ